MRPAILEAALNGGTRKATNPNVPRSTHELIQDAFACLDAGAAIVHTHIDEPGAPAERAAELYAEHFAPILDSRPDALLYPTVGFAATVEASFAHFPILVERLGLRIGIVDPGCVNLAGFAYVNTPEAIRHMVLLCARLELGPSIAIFEPGFLRHALGYFRRGALPRGALLKFYMGGTHADLGFGLPPTPRMLDVYLELLGESPLPWSVGVLGGDVFEHGLARHALERGGHLHLGLEDHAGARKPTNVELLHEAVSLCREVGRPPANCAEAARLLDLPR
ncbi:MAG: 3-keto-5-aminohexanoate cleavage protein [Myxococcota bacterium]